MRTAYDHISGVHVLVAYRQVQRRRHLSARTVPRRNHVIAISYHEFRLDAVREFCRSDDLKRFFPAAVFAPPDAPSVGSGQATIEIIGYCIYIAGCSLGCREKNHLNRSVLQGVIIILIC